MRVAINFKRLVTWIYDPDFPNSGAAIDQQG